MALATWSLGALSSCDALEQSLQGQAAPLKEPELPNCSRILTCCANLDARTLMPDSVKQACAGITTPTDSVIVQYQSSKATIQQSTTMTPQAKASALDELRRDTQATMEPACRCLLEETVGNVSLDDFLAPADCETVTTSGALPDNAKCDDVTGVITNPQP
ncbi:MAG: hypothetical protein U1F43_09445 [Myxococcota bacterium]